MPPQPGAYLVGRTRCHWGERTGPGCPGLSGRGTFNSRTLIVLPAHLGISVGSTTNGGVRTAPNIGDDSKVYIGGLSVVVFHAPGVGE
jgi:hypothetical protein